MAVTLFAHNEKAYRSAVSMMDTTGKAAIVHPTGTGKSYIAFKLIEDNPDKQIVWLSPSDYIFKTQQENLALSDPELKLDNVHFYTYVKLMRSTQAELEAIAALAPAYIILDELHRVGAPKWEVPVQWLIDHCAGAKLLGLTATNIRYLDNRRDMAEEFFGGNIASQMTLGEAVVRGILPAPTYVTTIYRYAEDLERYQKRVNNLSAKALQAVNQRYLDALRRALAQAKGLDKVFANHMQRPGKYIVFCSGREHMREMIAQVPEWFGGIDPAPAIYRAYSLDPETSKAFAKFKADESDHLKLLFCIDMLNEGVHVKGVSGVILFRPTISPIIYKQQIGRALTSGDLGAPLIIDAVNNLESLVSIDSLQEEMNTAVARMYANGEGEQIVTERFEVIEEVRDCRILFEQLRNSLNSAWDQYFLAASEYAAEHGNLNVPGEYRTPAGLSLGRWITAQRQIYAGTAQSGTLTQQQIDRLDGIGMVWDNRLDLAWSKGYEHAKAYHTKYGDLLVANAYCAEDGFALGRWINKLRQARANGDRPYLVTPERIALLDELGMVWDVVGARWEAFYAAAAAYYAAHGNLKMTQTYITPDGIKLGAWVLDMRRRYKCGAPGTGRDPLSQTQIQRLTDIGMVWDSPADLKWMESYNEAKRYYLAHGNLDIPVLYRAPNGLQLGKWVRKQVDVYFADQTDKKLFGKLTPERIKLLEAIGIQWKKEDPWLHRYELTRQYKAQTGTLKIPAQYKTNDGIWLNRWLNRQQHLMRDEGYHLKTHDAPLKDWQKQKLQELGL